MITLKHIGRTVGALALLLVASNSQATVWTVDQVLGGNSGFGASLFHKASNSNPMGGATLAHIAGTGVLGSYDDMTGALNVVLNYYSDAAETNLLGTATLTGMLFFDANGVLDDDYDIALTLTDPLIGSRTNHTLTFTDGYQCCGGDENDPNTFLPDDDFVAGGTSMTLWGADGFNHTTQSFGGKPRTRLGVDLRLNLTATAVPEPGTAMLMGLGLLGMAGMRRVRRKR